MVAQWTQAALAGAIMAAGLALVLWRLIPRPPDARAALTEPEAVPESSSRMDQTVELEPPSSRLVVFQERLGQWANNRLPRVMNPVGRSADLELLGLTSALFTGQRLAAFLAGVLAPPLIVWGMSVAGSAPPWSLSVVVAVGAGVLASLLVDQNVKQRAERARAEFTTLMTAYVDLVAVERLSGSGARLALESAAEVGDSWVFGRIKDELAASAWAGRPPWEGLRQLAKRVNVAELGDLADIMRVSGTEDVQVFATLRARSEAMRSMILNRELAQANETAERLSVPVSILGIIFVIILVGPAFVVMLTS
jgi:hypothetical protein